MWWYWPVFWDWSAFMTDPLPEGYVVHLPAPKNKPHHLFGAAVTVAPDPSRGRHQQTERVCAVCGTVKVTVHHADGRAWREWRVPGAERQFEDDRTPACTVATP